MTSGMRLAPRYLADRLAATGFCMALLAFSLVAADAAAQAQTPVAPLPPKAAASKPRILATKPDWAALTPAQQIALSPLAPAWDGISEVQKRKWLALSQNYPSLSAAERSTLHGRMTEWAALSPAQRNQARLNFAQTQSLSTEEKKAQWQAYQALSPEQKKQLAAVAQSKAAGAAPAVTPIAPNKLAAVPVTRSDSGNPASAASRPHSSASSAVAAVAPKLPGSAPAPAARP